MDGVWRPNLWSWRKYYKQSVIMLVMALMQNYNPRLSVFQSVWLWCWSLSGGYSSWYHWGDHMKERVMCRACSMHEVRWVHIKFRLQNLKGGYYLEDIDIGGFILKWILKQRWCEVVAQVRAQWRLLWTQRWTFTFYKMLEILWLAEWLVASAPWN
jgi:hypothetical protein